MENGGRQSLHIQSQPVEDIRYGDGVLQIELSGWAPVLVIDAARHVTCAAYQLEICGGRSTTASLRLRD